MGNLDWHCSYRFDPPVFWYQTSVQGNASANLATRVGKRYEDMNPQTVLGIGILMVVALMIIIGIVVLSSYLSSAGHVLTLLRKIAHAHDGGLVGEGRRVSVRIKRKGVEFVVTGKYLKGEPYLSVETHWPDPSFRAKFFPETISDAMKNFIGMQDIKIGDKKFDDRFVIQSDNVEGLVGFLTPENQDAIFILGDKAVLNFSGGVVRLERKIKTFSDAITANNIVMRFMKSYHVLRDQTSNLGGAITFTAMSVDVQCAVCMVCGDQIVDRQVFCSSCDTPHHDDCWVYLGQCSIYGCGETNKKPQRLKKKRFTIR